MKIINIGFNYPRHQDEMTDYNVKEPVFFFKPDTTLLRDNDSFYVPEKLGQIDYECEVVIKIDKMIKGMDARFAAKCYSEIGLGIDFTARDIQRKCVACGYPWDASKSFDYSSVISPVFIRKEELPPVDRLHFRLEKNGVTVQQGYTGDMVLSVDRIIEMVSSYSTLKTGDLIYTGTPEGVGPVVPGDRLTGYLEERVMFDFMIK